MANACGIASVFRTLVNDSRKQLVKEIKQAINVKPDGWQHIDAVMDNALREMVNSYDKALSTMARIMEQHGIQPTEDDLKTLLNLEVYIEVLSSLLAAHFEVIIANERAVHDAHLHLDRCQRAAEEYTDELMPVFTRGER